LHTAIIVLAREARLKGFVPVDVRALTTHRDLVGGRTLFLIDREPHGAVLAPLVRATIGTPRAHVCLLAGAREPRGIGGVAIGRIQADALVAALRPRAPTPAIEERWQRTARRAHGLPARFARSLWPGPLRRPLPEQPCRVAEHPPVYGGNASGDSDGENDSQTAAEDAQTVPADCPGPGWLAPGELAALQRRAEQASALLSAGRHAPGLRLLRQAVGGLARRRAWRAAIQGSLTLSAELLKRGRPRDALRALDEAGEYAHQSGDTAQLPDIAVLAGEGWIDSAHLDEAERVLSASLTSARAGGDARSEVSLATSLARCLFWRGEYPEASSVLESVAAEAAPPSVTVRRHRMMARLAVAQGHSAGALDAVDEARSRATSANDRVLQADVAATSAFVKLVVGDLDGVDRDASSAVAAARSARHPLRALSARLLRAEADRRRRRLAQGTGLTAVRRLAATAPPVLKARWDLLIALVDSTDAENVAIRHASATGLKALTLFAGTAAQAAPRVNHDPFVEEVVAVLHVCQRADDELALLQDICGRVRRGVRAAAVAFAAHTARGCETLAGDGPRMELDIAERAIGAGMTILPHRVRDRLEAAAVVHYGGTSIGALTARWTIGASNDLSRVPGMLAMVATAAAPLVSALMTRRTRSNTPHGLDLVGLTPSVQELRRAVERAATAPFAVLVEGESGSGKELVARGIHQTGPRRTRPFCILNCAALPDDLVEAELFGHARGSFTGAIADRPGVFEEANGGTLFLDEIGELSPRAQAKVLRVIQEGEIRRIGENMARRVDVRLVSATNRDLRREVDAGRFRLDLLYRLDVVRIQVPPLRERREDIALLLDHFWADLTRRIGSRAVLSAGVRAALMAYDWPGNVRELQNVLAALVVRSPKRGVVPPTALPAHVATVPEPTALRLRAARRTFEHGFIRAALLKSGGHRGRAADQLGVTRQGLTKLMARLGIE
jgi:DNA-binding NtrC family response regulator